MTTPSRLDACGSPAWATLQSLSGDLTSRPIADLFARDGARFDRCCVQGAGLTLDFSRQRVDARVLVCFAQLVEDVGLRERIQAQYRGDVLNPTEGRAVLHTALRRRGAPFAAEVAAERDRMLSFAQGVRAGRVRSSRGEPFSLVVNIGIGGSDLGPAMAVEALRSYRQGGPRVAFVSNVDGNRLAAVLAEADPARTLFIVCSKTFTTLETLTNATAARAWIARTLGEKAVPDHFSAVSVNAAAMDHFGIHPDHRFAMWDWVGGRYSIWSSIGVSLAIAIGRDHFEAFLAGGAEMDEHFLTAPWASNLPALMAALGVWNIDFLHLPTLAVLPYDDCLARLPAYLQQLEMESNGKSVRLDGSPTFAPTAAVIWGEPGNNAQHSFFQLLHQGTPCAALDFLLPARSSCGDQHAQDLAAANCLAQAEAFAYGQGPDAIHAAPELVPHKVHPGNRPSSIILFERLDPATLGRILALYEHKVFTQSVLWGINAFDQWGVELGKKLCEGLIPFFDSNQEPPSASLRGTLSRYKSLRGAT